MDNLGKIGESLNPNFNESIEKELQQSFRLAAQSLTELFKGGKKATKKSYLAGKREALQDVLEFLQATLDHPLPPATIGNFNQQQQQQNNTVGPFNVARLIDYICARQETLKAEEQEEDNEETIPSRSTHHHSSNPTASTSSSIRPNSTSIPSSHSQPPPQSQQQHSLNRRNDSIPATSSAPSSPQRFSISNASNNSNDASAIASTSQLPSSTTTTAPSTISIPFHQQGINSLTSTPISRTQTQILGHPVPFLPSSSSSSSSSTHQHNNTLLLPSSPLSLSTPTIASTNTNISHHHRKSLNPNLTTRKGKSTSHTNRSNSIHSESTLNELGVLTPQQLVTVGAGVGGPSEETLLGSMKRRWTHTSLPTTTDEIIELGNDSLMGMGVSSSDEIVAGEGGGEEKGGGEDQIMDFMEGWDGRDERPSKRVSRR